MPTVYVGIGSNKDRSNNIFNTKNILRDLFHNVIFSIVYESKAVGFSGENFYNLVACFDTSLSLDLLKIRLKSIETELGRKNKKDEVIIDLDILLYGELIDQTGNIPRAEITKQAFILRPLSEIAEKLRHPILKISYKELWDNFPKEKQPLKQIQLAGENT